MPSNREYKEKAIAAAKKAREVLLEKFPVKHGLNSQQRSDLMNVADREVHDCIYLALSKDYPDHEYISVYTGNQTFFKDRPLWVFDPIVGLGNYGHGDPGFALSIALMLNGTTEVAVIYNPVFDELFTTIKGQGAFCNDKPIHVSNTDQLKSALLSTRFPYDIREGKTTNLMLFNHLIMQAEGVLNNGTATLDLAYVAKGRYDGFWAMRMNPWDLTAAVLLIEEAGGKVSALSGKGYLTESREILATNGIIHQEILEAIAEIPKKEREINT